MSWIQTYTGRQFWPLDPRPEDVDIMDIAHSLSLHCRFNGHCIRPYSVAEHCIRVAEFVTHLGIFQDRAKESSDNLIRQALLHDAAEAYLPDLCRPIKPAWREFAKIESRLLECIHEALGVEVNQDDQTTIKFADSSLLATEARDLMTVCAVAWQSLPDPANRPISKYEPLWRTVKSDWLSVFHKPSIISGLVSYRSQY